MERSLEWSLRPLLNLEGGGDPGDCAFLLEDRLGDEERERERERDGMRGGDRDLLLYLGDGDLLIERDKDL